MIKTTFLDGTEYSAEDLNNILALFGVSGIFEDNTIYDVTALNDITKALVSQGVSLDENFPHGSFRLRKDSNGYYLTQGTAFFGTGAVTELEGEYRINNMSLPGYVYLDETTGIDDTVKVSADVPEESETIILLGYVNTDGNITDLRMQAKMKNEGFESDFYIPKKMRFGSFTLAPAQTTQTWLFDLKTTSVRFMAVIPYFDTENINGNKTSEYRTNTKVGMTFLTGTGEELTPLSSGNWYYNGKYEESVKLIKAQRVAGTTQWTFTFQGEYGVASLNSTLPVSYVDFYYI